MQPPLVPHVRVLVGLLFCTLGDQDRSSWISLLQQEGRGRPPACSHSKSGPSHFVVLASAMQSHDGKIHVALGPKLRIPVIFMVPEWGITHTYIYICIYNIIYIYRIQEIQLQSIWMPLPTSKWGLVGRSHISSTHSHMQRKQLVLGPVAVASPPTQRHACWRRPGSTRRFLACPSIWLVPQFAMENHQFYHVKR